MPTHHPTAAQSLMRFAHFVGIERKPKATPGKATKAAAPVPAKRPVRAQAATQAPASRFLHLNANLPPARPQHMTTQRAAEPPPTPQAMAAQILRAGKPRAAPAPRTEPEKIAAGVLATARKLQPGRF